MPWRFVTNLYTIYIHTLNSCKILGPFTGNMFFSKGADFILHHQLTAANEKLKVMIIVYIL
jgi:hypothetical protein